MEIDQNTMSISPVIIYNVVNDGALERRYEHHCRLEIELIDPETFKVQCFPDGAGDGKSIFQFNVTQDTDTARFGKDSQVFSFDCENICIRFYQSSDVQQVRTMLDKLKGRNLPSVFNQRTEETSASQYFQFYGYLSQQQNMLMDYVRTSTYQKAVFNNLSDFENKIVLDVGAGSGILSFFAAQAGAKKVYAVEASNMAQFAQQLVKSNKLESVIQVVAGKIEEITLPEKVDIIISEPMGYMLYNERMLETYIHAKKWLAPGGKMFPSRADLHVAPFRDDALYSEQFNKANFWCNTQFHGVDLSSMYNYAMKEYFRQPVVDTFDIRCCISKSVRHSVDFLTANESDLHKIYIPLEFHILESGTCHGLAFWFDVEFCGSTQQIWLSTAPTEPLTHWYQVRCLLLHPIYLKQGQLVTGNVLLVANKKQSYDVTIHLNVEGTLHTSTNTMDLKNPYFRYTGSTISTTVNQNSTITSNTESDYWNTIEPQFTNNKNNNLNAYNLTNGIELPSLDISLTLSNTNLLGAGNPQPDIHPGCISGTGRGGATAIVNMNGQSSGNILPANVINNTANLPSIGLGTSGLGSILNNGLASVPLGTGGLNLLSGNLTQVGGATTSGLIAATSTQSVAQQQLIGGAISPSLFITTTTPLVTGPGAASAFQQPGIQPLDLNSLLVAPQVILAPAALSSANGAPNPHL